MSPKPAQATSAQTLQQERAKYALRQVEKAVADKKIDQKDFKSYASGLPAMILMNGLGQAAATYRSKGDHTHSQLYDLLSGWLCGANQPYAGKDDLLKGITECNMQTYRIAQAEALMLLDWVKKFAKAYMKDT